MFGISSEKAIQKAKFIAIRVDDDRNLEQILFLFQLSYMNSISIDDI